MVISSGVPVGRARMFLRRFRFLSMFAPPHPVTGHFARLGLHGGFFLGAAPVTTEEKTNGTSSNRNMRLFILENLRAREGGRAVGLYHRSDRKARKFCQTIDRSFGSLFRTRIKEF